MGQPLEVVASDLHLAAARLQEAGQRLQDGLSGVDLETRELLGSGWRGGAASAFSSAWEQWHSGAGKVVRALQSMSELLTVAAKEYSKIDEQAAGAVGSPFPDPGGSGGTATGSSPSGQAAAQASSGQGGGSGANTQSGAGGFDGAAQRSASLADQMMPLGLQIIQPLAQAAGQVAAGLAQSAAQVAAQAAQSHPGGDGRSAENDDIDKPDDDAHPREGAGHPQEPSDGSEERDESGGASGGDRSAPPAPVHVTAAEPPSQSPSPSSGSHADWSGGSRR